MVVALLLALRRAVVAVLVLVVGLLLLALVGLVARPVGGFLLPPVLLFLPAVFRWNGGVVVIAAAAAALVVGAVTGGAAAASAAPRVGVTAVAVELTYTERKASAQRAAVGKRGGFFGGKKGDRHTRRYLKDEGS